MNNLEALDSRSNFPVNVTWYGATAFAQHYGYDLPTDAEWEKAARGGLVGKRYPWGDEAPNEGGTYRANYGPGDDGKGDDGKADGYEYTAPVGSYPANGYGLYDMSGNVWEWCMDEYQADFYSKSPRTSTNPIAGESILYVMKNFTNVKSWRVLRGGSWLLNIYGVRVALRLRIYPDVRFASFGFRCVSAR